VELPVPIRRFGYRLAYAGLRLYWLLIRPESSGVKCLLTDGERVLLVRHTYGYRGWDLPGGSIKRGEAPEAAARREMNEELGLWIDSWRALGQFAVTVDHRMDRVQCFQAEVSDPALTLDLGELAAASWFPRDALPADVGHYARRILAQALTDSSASPR
jgi:8-oxo-dGTP pyrophosphatase MutT (NUDIX family)